MGYEDKWSACVKEQMAKWGAQGMPWGSGWKKRRKIAHNAKPLNTVSLMWMLQIVFYIMQLIQSDEKR